MLTPIALRFLNVEYKPGLQIQDPSTNCVMAKVTKWPLPVG
jgi:hypothetical protein